MLLAFWPGKHGYVVCLLTYDILEKRENGYSWSHAGLQGSSVQYWSPYNIVTKYLSKNHLWEKRFSLPHGSRGCSPLFLGGGRAKHHGMQGHVREQSTYLLSARTRSRRRGLESRMPFRACKMTQHGSVPVPKPGTCGGRREPPPTGCSLPSPCVPWHACPHMFASPHKINE